MLSLLVVRNQDSLKQFCQKFQGIPSVVVCVSVMFLTEVGHRNKTVPHIES